MLTLFNFIATRFSVSAAWRAFTLWVPVLALLAGAAAGAWGGWQLGRAPLLVSLAELRETHTEQTRLVQQASAKRLQVAQERGESLAAELAQTLTTNAQLTQEKTHALQTATDGRACLSNRALRVLHGAPGIRVAGADGLPAPKPPAAAAGATAAAPAHDAGQQNPDKPQPDELVATDTGLALWIANAGGQYEACRQRLNALIAWHHQPTHTEPPREPQ